MGNHSDRFATVLRRAREDAGLSQIQASKLIGVSRSTIQKWEEGTATPNMKKCLDYFKKLQRPPTPYMLYMCDPDHYAQATIDSTRDTLHDLINALDDETIKKLFYVCFANHGSNSFAVLEMIVAHLQTPLRARLNVAHDILMNYQIASHHEDLSRKSNTYPDIELLSNSITSCTDAVINNKSSYASIK